MVTEADLSLVKCGVMRRELRGERGVRLSMSRLRFSGERSDGLVLVRVEGGSLMVGLVEKKDLPASFLCLR